MSTSFSTSTQVEFLGNKRKKTVTTVHYVKNSEGRWEEAAKTVVIEEVEEPLFQPTVPQQPSPAPGWSYSPIVWCSEPISLVQTTASAIPDPPKPPHQPYA